MCSLLLLLLLYGLFAVPSSCAPAARCRLHQQQVVPLSTSPSPQPASTSSGTAGSDGKTGAQPREAATAASRTLISYDDPEIAAHSPSNSGGYADSESRETGISVDNRDGETSGDGRESAGEIRDSDGESASGIAGASGEDGEPAHDGGVREDDGSRTTAVQPDDDVRSSRAGESHHSAMSGAEGQTGFWGTGESGFGDSFTDSAAETGFVGDTSPGADPNGRLSMRHGDAGDRVSDSNLTGGCNAGETCYVAQNSGQSGDLRSNGSQDTDASASATATGGTDTDSPSGGKGESLNETRHVGDTRDAGDSEMMSRMEDGDQATGLRMTELGSMAW